VSNVLTDHTIKTFLVAVGADPAIEPADFDTSFEDLDLDSLARAEFAARVREATGVDVEDRLDPAVTPTAVRRMVLDQLSTVDR
jgi:hypothetical protein